LAFGDQGQHCCARTSIIDSGLRPNDNLREQEAADDESHPLIT
jgi:hypothetical protein